MTSGSTSPRGHPSMATSLSVPKIATSGVEKRKHKKTNSLRAHKNVKCGVLKRKGFFGNWKELYFSLETGTLMEFKDSSAKKAEKAYSLPDYTVQAAENLSGVAHSLALMNAKDNKTIFLAANSAAELREWMGALKGFCRPTNLDQSLEMTLKAINDAAVLCDESGTILCINQPASELFGWSKEEIVGKDIKILMPKEFAAVHDRWMERYRVTHEKRLIGTPRQVPCARKDHSIIPCVLSLGVLATGSEEEKRFLGTFRSVELLRQDYDLGVPRSEDTTTASEQPNGVPTSPRKKDASEQEIDRQMANIMGTVKAVVGEELSKANKSAHKYRSRYLRLKKKNAGLNSEIVNLIGDLRLGNRSNQMSSMAFYHSISNGEASNEVEIIQHLKGVITQEINACTSPGTLFRDDCVNTQKLSSFFLYQGSSYVIRTLDKFLSEFCCCNEGDNLHFELNDPNASGEELKVREKRLLDGVHLLLSGVKNTAKEVPASFGLLFKHIHTELPTKFLSLDSYSIMSSFLFLRLLIPALVQPQRYHLMLSRPLSTGDRRGLMLISKILINTANGIVFNEGYMQVFNSTIAQNVPILQSIFDDIMLRNERSDSFSSSLHDGGDTDRTSEEDDVTTEEPSQMEQP